MCRVNCLFTAKKVPLPSGDGRGLGVELLLSDSAHGAAALASAAVDADAGVDNHMLIARGNGPDGAGIHASAAGNAAVIDFPCHEVNTSVCRIVVWCEPKPILAYLCKIARRIFNFPAPDMYKIP